VVIFPGATTTTDALVVAKTPYVDMLKIRNIHTGKADINDAKGNLGKDAKLTHTTVAGRDGRALTIKKFRVPEEVWDAITSEFTYSSFLWQATILVSWAPHIHVHYMYIHHVVDKAFQLQNEL
jgi:hypothetical protein